MNWFNLNFKNNHHKYLNKMKLICINKYLIQAIFSFLNYSKELNIVRYNKKYKSKLEITLYSYQKKYFDSIISPAIFDNIEILSKNKIFDKDTLYKLKADWENETSEIINENDCFHFEQKIKQKDIFNTHILNIFKEDKFIFEKNMPPNLIELNISKIKNLELSCSILLNLESFSLKDISRLTLLNREQTISLNKLKHLYLDNISFNKNNNIQIKLDNIKYLDLRLKEQEGDDEEFENDKNTSGFYKENTINFFIKIFDFQFLSLFNLDTSKNYKFSEDEDEDKEDNNEKRNNKEKNSDGDDEEDEDESENYEMDFDEDLNEENEINYEEKFDDLEPIFKNLQIFDKIFIGKYDYFNFEILYEYYFESGAADYSQRFKYKYLFSKTKGNKYIFNTKNEKYVNINGDEYEYNINEIRYCNKMNHNNYYYIDNEIEVNGNYFCHDDNLDELDFDYIKKIKTHSNDFFSSGLYLLENKNNKSRLETMIIDNLDITKNNDFLEILPDFTELKCFYVKDDLIFQNIKQIIDLLKILSKVKSLFLIYIAIDGKRELSNKVDIKIREIFPDISINRTKNKSYIKLMNNNLVIKKNN